MPSVCPSLHLPRNEARRLAERGQSAGRDINRVQACKRGDDCLADAPSIGRRGDYRRLLSAHHDSVAAFHRIENGSDHAGIFAEDVRSRRRRKHRVHRRQPVKFARHVVRFRRDRTERWTANDDFRGAESNQVGEVGMSARELRDFGLLADVEAWDAARRQPLAQPGHQSRPIKLFARANSSHVVIHFRALRTSRTSRELIGESCFRCQSGQGFRNR